MTKRLKHNLKTWMMYSYFKMKNIHVNIGRFLLRIILSPFVFLWGVLLLIAGTIFPLPLLVVF